MIAIAYNPLPHRDEQGRGARVVDKIAWSDFERRSRPKGGGQEAHH